MVAGQGGGTKQSREIAGTGHKANGEAHSSFHWWVRTGSNEHLQYTEMGDPDGSEGGALVGALVPFKGSGKGVPLPFQR